MDIQHQLEAFESGLNPQYPERSAIPAEVKGFGEISSIFGLKEITGWVFKRLPLFVEFHQAEAYVANYHQYVLHLKQAGLTLPADRAYIVRGRKICLYLAQEELPGPSVCHKLLHRQSDPENLEMIRKIFREINKVFAFNRDHKPKIEISIDGQISNWVQVNEELWFIDTSTPLFRLDGEEQLDPELLLNSTPGALKWIIRRFFLADVMNRYYDQRLVYIDVVANLHKEQMPQLITPALVLANQELPPEISPISQKEVDAYYREDKIIWQIFLRFRKIDRWVTQNLFQKKYEFILPGKIKR